MRIRNPAAPPIHFLDSWLPRNVNDDIYFGILQGINHQKFGCGSRLRLLLLRANPQNFADIKHFKNHSLREMKHLFPSYCISLVSVLVAI